MLLAGNARGPVPGRSVVPLLPPPDDLEDAAMPDSAPGTPGGPRPRGPWWLPVLVAPALVLAGCGGGDATSAPGGAAARTAGTSAAAPAGAAAGQATGAVGTLSAADRPLLPLAQAAPDGDLAEYEGDPVQAKGVLVESVPSDTGFWAGSGGDDRVFVFLVGAGSRPRVKKGDRVDFTGTVEAQSTEFAARQGLSAEEGADLLRRQGAHLTVEKSAVKPSR